ncbi:MAG: endonuclease/exonuclease/phosphatase family protein [Bacteroidales bacterium]|nr:endonuclease/exonuclease/phosphatase family protein [Bacteroidales bacterium]
MRYRILSFFMLLFAVSALAAKEPVKPASVETMTFNIRYGTADDGTNSWYYRAGSVIEMINDQTPDIIGMQEVLREQIDLLKDYLSYKCIGVGREDGKKGGEHMCIFYNPKTVKIQKWGTYWLSETPDKPSKGWDGACKRTATWALVKMKESGKLFYFVNTHLDHVGVEARKKGLELILERIGKMNKEGYPLILSGDFNVSPEDETLAPLAGKMRSARDWAFRTDEGATYNAWGHKENESVIDHIFVSGFSGCPVFEVVRKPYLEKKFISDHYPVKATLIF